MINSIQGIVLHTGHESIVLEVGGIGIRLEVPTSVVEASPGVGKRLLLHTQLILREDSVSIYGFLDEEQRDLFNSVIKVSGVGPRLGLAMLSNLSIEVLQSAVANDQPEVLERVPGIGRKTAQKIVLDLKDRLKAPVSIVPITGKRDSEVIEVLTALGYTMIEAQAALKSIPPDASEEVEERVRLALQYFAHS
ncbi:MAG: Holliday junction branch migration protein RuvA [Anaerolineales bacterium]|nr:Holliday junction branch migration protein RuvA [Anaerolineales bacterium]